MMNNFNLNNHKFHFERKRSSEFISTLQGLDQKEKIRELQEHYVSSINGVVQSGTHFEPYYNIERLNYSLIHDTENRSQCLTVLSSTTTRISSNDLSCFINLSNLSESDRLCFLREIDIIGCFAMKDGKSEIIVIKSPEITPKKPNKKTTYTVLQYKSQRFKKLTNFHLHSAHVAYSFNSHSQTLVLYDTATRQVKICLFDESGQVTYSDANLESNSYLSESKGVKSLALTGSQDLLILIDSYSNVYSIVLGKEGAGSRASSLVKNPRALDDKPDFKADDDNLYQTVQTIGEKHPVFFFQATSCIDIIDQNYCQMHSIKLENPSPSYKMKIFSDCIDTYCVIFNGNINEAYCIQNLVSDTRIERQDSRHNLKESTSQYIGNRLLDIIKCGEIQFGIPDSVEETQYYFLLSPEYSDYSDRIKTYFNALRIKAQLNLNFKETNLICSFIDIDKLIKTVISRVPLQLCTIDMGTLVPLNDGKRDKMDHLSSKSFRIEMKAREISFSYLDHILMDIDENIKIIGVIGRQSTGKSYLMNKIFRTRFSVAAGRCTDGIWMSYAYLGNQHFIILDCEGLFSDQRTEDEEIKLISFLAAVCDVTILSQDLGFSRFQDRLFSALSQAVDKISKNDKLFKGILLVAMRDISDGGANEASSAAEKKFSDLQKKGKSDFLEKLFSNKFTVQLLHHFENSNFESEVENLRQLFLEHNTIDGSGRWESGKDLVDRLKILLVQLYTDDFIDSNEIHSNMKLAELEEEMKNAWTRFIFNDEENFVKREQQIEKESQGKTLLVKLNHTELELDEKSSDSNFYNMCSFILTQLSLIDALPKNTKEDVNELYVYINDLICDLITFRRQQVDQWISQRFEKEFPDKNDNNKERKVKFMSSGEQYMRSFKLQICLKKCSSCSLRCVKNAQHTDEAKDLLEKKKTEFAQLQSSIGTIASNNHLEDTVKKLKKDLNSKEEEENKLRGGMDQLFNESKVLIDKEKLEKNIENYNSTLSTENEKAGTYERRVNEIHQELKALLSMENDPEDKDKLVDNLEEDVKQSINSIHEEYNNLRELMKKFVPDHETDSTLAFELLNSSARSEQTDTIETISDCQPNVLLSHIKIDQTNICGWHELTQKRLETNKKQLESKLQDLESSKSQIKEIEQNIIDAEKSKEEIEKLIETKTTECEQFKDQLSKINAEQSALASSKEIDEGKKSIDSEVSFEIQLLQHYRNDLQDQLASYSDSSLSNDNVEERKQSEYMASADLSKENVEKISNLAVHKDKIHSSDDHSQIQELRGYTNEERQTVGAISEKIDDNEAEIQSIGGERFVSHKEQNRKQQLHEEIEKVDQFMETIKPYDLHIKETDNKLLKTIKEKKLKEEHIEKLKKEEIDDVEKEEAGLDDLNKKIENTKTELNNIKEGKTSACNKSALWLKISNGHRHNIEHRRENRQNRLTELSEKSQDLNKNVEQLEESLSSEKNRLTDQNMKISNFKDTENFQINNREQHKKIIQNITVLNVVGENLFRSLSNVEKSLATTSEKLGKISKVKSLIQKYKSFSETLTTTVKEQDRLRMLLEESNEKLTEVKAKTHSFKYTNSRGCKKQYDQVVQEYNNACSQTSELKKELSDMDDYSRLSLEISRLEKATQQKCDCGTDHHCSGICQICSGEDGTKQKKCMFLAGHTGDHKCDAGHVCTKYCQICEIYGFPNKRCVLPYEHTEPQHHQCDGTHQCPATCVCSDPCTIPLKLQKHEEHRCNKEDCWKKCIFECGSLCTVNDHNHDATAETVSITIGNKAHEMKKHLCNQSHYCRGICNAPGACKQEYRTQERIWETESGAEFSYEHIEVEEVRAKCGIKIGEGRTSHDETNSHCCGGQHTCPERCPDCDSFCRKPVHHDGYHTTLHRNKDQHMFTSTNPSEKIEIHIGEAEWANVRTYKVGESSKPENCSMSCKRRGRSHIHLVECPGDSKCWSKVLGESSKH